MAPVWMHQGAEKRRFVRVLPRSRAEAGRQRASGANPRFGQHATLGASLICLCPERGLAPRHPERDPEETDRATRKNCPTRDPWPFPQTRETPSRARRVTAHPCWSNGPGWMRLRHRHQDRRSRHRCTLVVSRLTHEVGHRGCGQPHRRIGSGRARRERLGSSEDAGGPSPGLDGGRSTARPARSRCREVSARAGHAALVAGWPPWKLESSLPRGARLSCCSREPARPKLPVISSRTRRP